MTLRVLKRLLPLFIVFDELGIVAAHILDDLR